VKTCLPAGSGVSPATGSLRRGVARGAMPTFRLERSRRHLDLARVDRSRRASRAVRPSGETRRRAHLFSYSSLAACVKGLAHRLGRPEVPRTCHSEPSGAASIFNSPRVVAMARAALPAPDAPVIHGLDGTQTACLGMASAKPAAPAMPVTNGLDGSQSAETSKRGARGASKARALCLIGIGRAALPLPAVAVSDGMNGVQAGRATKKAAWA
jgi:hypothetical protein